MTRHVSPIRADEEDGGTYYRCACGKAFGFVPPALQHARNESKKELVLTLGEKEEANEREPARESTAE